MIPFLTSFRTVQVSKIVRVTIVRYIKNVEIRFGLETLAQIYCTFSTRKHMVLWLANFQGF